MKKGRRLVKAPLRMLCHARDFYVRSITSCGGMMPYTGGYTEPMCASYATTSRSFVVDVSDKPIFSDESLQEIVRTASVGRGPKGTVLYSAASGGLGTARESVDVIGRIDEDKSCEFDENELQIGSYLLLPKSRSSALGRKRRVIRPFV